MVIIIVAVLPEIGTGKAIGKAIPRDGYGLHIVRGGPLYPDAKLGLTLIRKYFTPDKGPFDS